MNFIDRIISREDLLWNRLDAEVPIVFWGVGSNMYAVRDTLEARKIRPAVFCDSNPGMWGKNIDGIPVISYESLKEHYSRYYIILTVAINNALEIVRQLRFEGEKNQIFHVEKAFKVGETFLEYNELESAVDIYENIYEMFADDLSKELFVENINFKLTGNKLTLVEFADGDTFFDSSLIPESKHYSYMDVGAYTGDTLLRFYAFCRGQYDKIYAVEPDNGNFQALKKLVKYGRLENVDLFHVGGWDRKDILTFYTVKGENKKNFDSPNFFEELKENMPVRWKIAQDEVFSEQVPVDTVDHLLKGKICNILKINALAADYETVRGAEETIRKYSPVLIGEFGTKKDNLTALLKYIHQINPSYKIYLREKKIFGDYKTVFYAVSHSFKDAKEQMQKG